MRVVIDLEATCAEDNHPTFDRTKSEIIEIGACLIDDQCRVLSEFQTFVKPVLSPMITPYCTRLTSIRQEDVDGAPSFKAAQDAMDQWFLDCERQYGEVMEWGSWGGYDKRQFIRNCGLLSVDEGNFLRIPHINLKDAYAAKHAGILTKKRAPGVGLALKQQGMLFEGKAHRAIDDARNIARLAMVVFDVTPSRLTRERANLLRQEMSM